ncbi:cytochrome P450 [Xylaria sp. FL0064]|nr:cytochrome P450 [Xylaria sp. FL0064]
MAQAVIFWGTFALTGLIILAHRMPLKQALNAILSRCIHHILVSVYPVRHVQDFSPLPTCIYEFPNGQGDQAKFFHGRQNSEVWEKQHGAIYRLWSGVSPEVVITRADHVQAVFKDSNMHSKAVNNNSGWFMGEILGQCVGLISGEQWKRVRAVVDVPFCHSTATSYVPAIRKRTKNFLQELWETKELSHGVLRPADDLKLFPFLITADIIYGPLTSELESELRELAPQREALFQWVMEGGLPRFAVSAYLPWTKANRDLAAFKEQWRLFNEKAHKSAVNRGILGAPIVDFFRARAEGKLSEREMLHTLDEMLFANLDVTIGAISWNVVFLAADRDVRARLLAEIESSGSGDSYVLSSTTLLAACVNESARLRPLAAFSVPQSIPTPRVVGGYMFPAGTNFIVDSYALNVRSPYWGKDGDFYRPDRFLERQRGGSTKIRYNYWRFGFGPRQCMGKYVADLVLRELLVQLVEGYELGLMLKESKEGSDEWERNPAVWIDHPDLQIKCVKKTQRADA